MPQEFNVLQCERCQTFQVQAVKKLPKWHCTMCSHKQPLAEIFMTAEAKHCRIQVQRLNAQRGALVEQALHRFPEETFRNSEANNYGSSAASQSFQSASTLPSRPGSGAGPAKK